MMMKKQYKTAEEKQALMSEYENKGYRLTEEQNLIDGNFLIFGPKTDYHKMNEETKKWDFDLDGYVEDVVRVERNKRLKETDYLMLSDTFALLSMGEQASLIGCRQALRDLPESLTSEALAMNISWQSFEKK